MVDEERVLGQRYRLKVRVASGGMGTVFVAKDERLGRMVAVKLLRDELAGDERFVERFRREARSAAALSHPNVASVYDYGEDDGCHFIVMEYADGRDLSHLLKDEGPLAAERATVIARQIAAALGHAHAAGLIHRDVKPANVIVNGSDHVKVTDFGIARAIGDSTLTASGTIMGTASYLSPEQAQGGVIDARSDVYAVGIVLFEMLTGAVPFSGGSAVSVAMRHLSDEVPAPSSIRPEVPPELDSIVLRATSKAPEDRFQDGAALASELQAFRTGSTDELLPAEAAEPTRVLTLPTGPWDPARLGRTVLITFAALIVLATALVVWRLSQDDPKADATSRRATAPAARESETQQPTATPSVTSSDVLEGIEIPEAIIGAPTKGADGATRILESLGLEVIEVKVPSDEEKHTIVATDPEPGSVLLPGETITLYVSDGKGDEEGEDD